MTEPRKKDSTWEDNYILSAIESRTHINKTNANSPQCVSVTFQNLFCKSVVYNSDYIFTKYEYIYIYKEY